jgi:hypothetical protein
MRLWIVLLILVIEAWAIAGVLGSRRPARRKAAWILAIVLLPVVGVLGWLGRGPK